MKIKFTTVDCAALFSVGLWSRQRISSTQCHAD